MPRLAMPCPMKSRPSAHLRSIGHVGETQLVLMPKQSGRCKPEPTETVVAGLGLLLAPSPPSPAGPCENTMRIKRQPFPFPIAKYAAQAFGALCVRSGGLGRLDSRACPMRALDWLPLRAPVLAATGKRMHIGPALPKPSPSVIPSSGRESQASWAICWCVLPRLSQKPPKQPGFTLRCFTMPRREQMLQCQPITASCSAQWIIQKLEPACLATNK